MRQQIELGEVLDASAFGVVNAIHKIMPGLVVAYHPSVPPAGGQAGSPPSVDVQPAVHDVRFDTELGTRVSEPWPILPEVPVLMPRFGGWAVRGKLAAGDHVLLLSFDLDPTAYRATGAAADPLDTRRHGGGYWVAIPCDLTDPGALEDPGDNLCIGKPGGPELQVTPTGIVLGTGATDYVALASKVDAVFQAIDTWVPVANDGGAALKALLTTSLLGSVASTFTQTK